MLDSALRPTKETILRPLCNAIPSTITPTHLTLAGFFVGLSSCYFTATSDHKSLVGTAIPLTLWLLNRLLDSLDGSLARARGTSMEAGGFLDLLCDFIIYSLIPAAVMYGEEIYRGAVDWKSIVFLEISFHINNFVLFYVAAVEAKVNTSHKNKKKPELTSLVMTPALVEGVESGVLFTLMLAFPRYIGSIAWIMGVAVSIGIVQRLVYLLPVLGTLDSAGPTDEKKE